MRICAVVSLLPVLAANGLAADFEKPIRLKAGGEFVRVEGPGYAAPCLADIDRDGKADLLVGQFNKGKIRVFKGEHPVSSEIKFAAGDWLKIGGEIVEVPGVW